ncbi:hypothetical protein RF11_15630 [Thelohanellus kitauei]|uniref:Uncharacterized protein n=1 Tax=Thelohanellus kitauei TaxID=669202 RepID=A0A0C2JWS5_THEKT|nr:hypothetical protein RF11_15630 [Thelohanellus kitauei]
MSGVNYIIELPMDQQLLLYEDFKRTYLSVINEDFIKTIFKDCASYLSHTFYREFSGISNFYGYGKYRKIMASLVCTFNEYTYLDENKRLYYFYWCTSKPKKILDTGYLPQFVYISEKKAYTITELSTLSPNLTLQALFKYFNLIYEQKFIFGHIDSKFTNLNFDNSSVS